MSASGAHHLRSRSLMSSETDEGGGTTTDDGTEQSPTTSTLDTHKAQYAPLSKAAHRHMTGTEIVYPSPARRTNSLGRTRGTRGVDRARLKKPPPPSYVPASVPLPTATAAAAATAGKPSKRTSLIDDDDDDDDDDEQKQGNHSHNKHNAYHGQSSLSLAYGHGHAMGNDTKRAAATTSSYPNDDLSYRPPSGDMVGRNTLPSIGYGRNMVSEDDRAQRKERRTLMSSTTAPEQASLHAYPRKLPPPSSVSTLKDPPPQHPHPTSNNTNSTKQTPLMDFPQTLAMWTAQLDQSFDQDEDESLLTAHAERTLLEIQQSRKKTTVSAASRVQNPQGDGAAAATTTTTGQHPQPHDLQQQTDELTTVTANETNEITDNTQQGKDVNINNNVNNGDGVDQDDFSTSLPPLDEGRREMSCILSNKHRPTPALHKPLEPNLTTTTARRLRRPKLPLLSSTILYEPHTGTTTITKTVDVMTGVTDGSLTVLEHRVSCLNCATPMVASKSALLVVCPRCHCKFPNRHSSSGTLMTATPAAAVGGGKVVPASGNGVTRTTTEWSL